MPTSALLGTGYVVQQWSTQWLQTCVVGAGVVAMDANKVLALGGVRCDEDAEDRVPHLANATDTNCGDACVVTAVDDHGKHMAFLTISNAKMQIVNGEWSDIINIPLALHELFEVRARAQAAPMPARRGHPSL